MVTCQICQKEKDLSEVRPGDSVRGGVLETIKKQSPQWSEDGYICLADLNHFRTTYVQEVLEEEMENIATLRSEAQRSVKEYEVLSKNINVEF